MRRPAVIGTDHVKADLQMAFTGLLEAFMAADHFRITAGDDVTLTEQGAACGLARRLVGHRVIARERAGVIEVFMLIDRGFLRRATCEAAQHKGHNRGTQGE